MSTYLGEERFVERYLKPLFPNPKHEEIAVLKRILLAELHWGWAYHKEIILSPDGNLKKQLDKALAEYDPDPYEDVYTWGVSESDPYWQARYDATRIYFESCLRLVDWTSRMLKDFPKEIDNFSQSVL